MDPAEVGSQLNQARHLHLLLMCCLHTLTCKSIMYTAVSCCWVNVNPITPMTGKSYKKHLLNQHAQTTDQYGVIIHSIICLRFLNHVQYLWVKISFWLAFKYVKIQGFRATVQTACKDFGDLFDFCFSSTFPLFWACFANCSSQD